MERSCRSRGIGALRRVRHLIPHETLITMYSSLVLPYFNIIIVIQYGGAVGGGCVTDSRSSKTGLPEYFKTTRVQIMIDGQLRYWMNLDGIILRHER